MGKKKVKPDKTSQGAARKAFFERGGTPKQWVGNPQTFKDKKKYDRKDGKRASDD